MIFSAIAGWFIERFWPAGLLVVIVITIASALISYARLDAINSNREIVGLEAYTNDLSVVLAGAGIDLVINLAVFLIVWTLRRRFKPHTKRDDKKADG